MASNNTLKLLAGKLGLCDEDKVINKAAEYLRLLNAKTTTGSHMSDTSKVVICLDLAAAMFNIDFDNKLGVKYSGLKGPSYANSKKNVENLLEINNNKLSISSLCLALQCGGAKTLAEKILEEYKRCSKTEIDLNLPQYVCMAVYQACRVNKLKVSKSKIIEKSRLKPAQWSKLDTSWSKLVADKFPMANKKGADQGNPNNNDDKSMEVCDSTVKEEKSSQPKIEPYEDWKRRMLESAYKELKELEKKEKAEKVGVQKEFMSPRRSPRKTPQKFSPYKCEKNPRMSTGIRLLFPTD